SVAAALVIGGLIGWLLVREPHETSTTTAQRAPSGSQAAAPSSTGSSNAAVSPAAGETAGPVTPLRDLGDVTDPNRLRTPLQQRFAKAPGPQDQSSVASVPCIQTPPRSVDLVAISAAGTGTYRSNPVTVLVGTTPDEPSHAVAVVLEPPDCKLVAS